MSDDLKKKKFDLNKIEDNVNPFNKAQWYRLMKWKETVESTGNRNLDYAFDLIDTLCARLELSRGIRDKCEDIYDECVEKGILTGRSIEGLVPCSVYVALRLEGIARTSSEVAEAGKITDKELLRTTRVICQTLNIRLPLLYPKDFVPRFSKALDVSEEVVNRCYELLDDCDAVGLSNGPSPTSLCGVCLYIACNECDERRTQRDVGEVCGVTDVTIRNNLKNVRKVLELN